MLNREATNWGLNPQPTASITPLIQLSVDENIDSHSDAS